MKKVSNEKLKFTLKSTKKDLKRWLYKNHKFFSEKLKTLSEKNLQTYSVFSSWVFNDNVTDLEGYYLLHNRVSDEMKRREVSQLWYQEPLRELDETLKY